MQEIIALGIAFAIMPVLIYKKLEVGLAFFVSGLILAVAAQISPAVVLSSLINVFTDLPTVRTLVTVVMVGVLGACMKEYKVLDRLIDALKQLIRNRKAIMIVLPATFGLLSVPGGAILSAPFVDEVGKDISLPVEKRVAANLFFRHLPMLVVPFSNPSIYTASIVTQVNIYTVLAMNAPIMALMVIGGYFICFRGIKAEPLPKSENRSKAAKDLLLYLSPIYLTVLLNVLFSIPMFLSVTISVVWTYFLTDKKNYFIRAVKSIRLSVIVMLIGIYFLQNLIQQLGSVSQLFTDLFNNASGFTLLCVIAGVSVVFGASTGLYWVPMGVLYPLVAALPAPTIVIAIYTFFVFTWSSLGYLYSPLHLCQLLSLRYMGCTTGSAFKINIRLIPILAVASFLLFYLYMFLFA